MDFVIASLPVLWLVLALVKLKLPGWQATSLAAFLSLALAVFYFEQSLPIMLSAALEGVALALWPVCSVIVAAIFSYNIVVATGAMENIKLLLSKVSRDKRVLGLLLAWGFGHFMEGMAGFGTSVAIPGAMMVALGFNPLSSILACLMANCVTTCLGGIGLGITVLGSMTDLDPYRLGLLVSIQMLALNIIIPFFMVAAMGGGVKAIKGVAGITLLAGLALAIPELIICYFFGPELSVIIPSIIIMLVLILCAKYFATDDPDYLVEVGELRSLSFREGFIAVVPYLFILIFLTFTSKVFPAIYEPLAQVTTSVNIYQGSGAKPYTFVWLANAGTMIFFATCLGGLVQKASPAKILKVFGQTIYNLRYSILTIIFIVVSAKLMTYAGMISIIANGIVLATGKFYPFFAPFIGAFGAFITGSATNCNVLFGPLQSAVAGKLSSDMNFTYWLVASNAGSGGIGKMVSPQSIAIAIAAITPAIAAYAKQKQISKDIEDNLYNSITPSSIMSSSYLYMFLFLTIYALITYFGSLLL